MSPRTTSNLTKAWEFLKSIAQGIVIFLLTGILKYQKMNYDWQIKMESRMQAREQVDAVQDINISKRQEYEHINDQEINRHEKQVTFLFAHFGLPLINN